MSSNILIVLKNFPAFYETPKVHYRVPKRPPLVPLLSQTNPIHTILRPILILSTHLCLGLPSGIFPYCFPTNFLYAIKYAINNKRKQLIIKIYNHNTGVLLEYLCTLLCLSAGSWKRIEGVRAELTAFDHGTSLDVNVELHAPIALLSTKYIFVCLFVHSINV
jgi:hypothetical protein